MTLSIEVGWLTAVTLVSMAPPSATPAAVTATYMQKEKLIREPVCACCVGIVFPSSYFNKNYF